MSQVDLLDVDKPIAEQSFTCLSFISPENIIQKKELYFFEEFVRQYDNTKSMNKFVEFINFISYKYKLPSEDIFKEFESFIVTDKETLSNDMSDDYKNFIDKNEDELEKAYSKANAFQTTTRGIKVRGTFPTQEEAELRCKSLRELDPNHDVYVGPVGTWLPFHPDAYKTGNVQYLEKELNTLMHEKQKNEEKAKIHFEERLKTDKIEAIQKNIDLAKETGNKLTQSINDKGELVSIENATTQDTVLGMNASLEDIKREIFEENKDDDK
jgi:hypothetical protein